MTTTRRIFLKALVGASIANIPGSLFSLAPHTAQAAMAPADFGEVRGLTIRCVSEVGWFDTQIIGDDVRKGGGMFTDQYEIPFSAENAAGYSALLLLEALDGTEHSYLLDTGWSTTWMDHAFAKSGVDAMLENHGLDGLIVSHDHNDHFWGIESTLKLWPDIPIYHPSTMQAKSFELLDGADFSSLSGNPRNRFPHFGQRIPVYPNELCVPLPGLAIAMFDVNIPLGVRGESVVYVKVKDKGYVVITGCGHPGIGTLIDFAANTFAGGDQMYGCYGGLHIAPFEMWQPEMQLSIDKIQASGMQKVACNHCTGRVWTKKALEQGIPIVQGTDAFRSYDRVVKNDPGTGANLYIGNGDHVRF